VPETVVETEHLETLADGCAGGVDEDSLTLPIATEVIDKIIHCSEVEILESLQILAWKEKVLVEGAAALALAGYLKNKKEYEGKNNVILLCGANFDKDLILEKIS
jgi:Threonine dehydratase